MWILLILALIVVIVIVIIIVVAMSGDEEVPTYSAAPSTPVGYAPNNVVDSAFTPERPVPVAGGSLTITSGAYLPTVSKTPTSSDFDNVTKETASPIVSAFRAIYPKLVGISRTHDKREIEKVITIGNATRVPTRAEAKVAYFAMINPLKVAGTPEARAEEQALQVEAEFADFIAQRAERIREIISSGLLCGNNADEAKLLGCKTGQTTSIPCLAGWKEVAVDHTRDSRNVPAVFLGGLQNKVCVPGTTPTKFSLFNGLSYPDPKNSKATRTITVGMR